MTFTQAPPRAELVRRAAGLVPLLRSSASWAYDNRRLSDEAVEAMADAGLFRMRVPARYGGYESDVRTVVDVTRELARGDGAAGWTASVWNIPGWMVGMFPDEAQDEVYSTPDVRVCGTLSPGGVGVPVDGGVVLNGKWGFISGALHSSWQEIIAVTVGPDGVPQPFMALVPMDELTIIDDWHTTSLRGSGSVSTVAQDVFVPGHRILPLGDVLAGRSASARNAALPMYRSPLLGVAAATTVGALLGLADAALELFLERLPDRKITYTGYESQREAPVTHLQVAEAAMKIDEAVFHGERVAGVVDRKGEAGEEWSPLERGRARGDVGAVAKLVAEAVGILAGASGGSSIYTSVPIQRILQDVQGTNLHALIYPPTNYELYGRLLCGLEPNTLYI